ncbi:MAG: aldo/keto reductase [Bacteroidota bacterium]
MQYVKLGASDLTVSRISLGCMSLGVEHAENARLIHHALDLGVNMLDTADLYDKGVNEVTVGKAIKGRREKVILATKVGNQWRPDGSGWDWNPTKAYIKQAVHESLRRLQTDYIDLYQLHGGTLDDPTEESIAAFEELKQEGLIRYYGISSIRPNVISKWLRVGSLTSIMSQYSLLDRRPEEETFDKIREAGVGVLVRGAVAKGLLAGKAAKPYLGHSQESIQKLQNTMQQMGVKPAHIAIQFAMQNPAVSTVVMGASSEKQMRENVEAVHASSLSEEEWGEVISLIPAMKYEKHR